MLNMTSQRTAKKVRRKPKRGNGLNRKKQRKISIKKIVEAAKNAMVKSTDSNKVITSALQGAQRMLKQFGGKKNVTIPRILPIPEKMGGALPLIPLFAGISALGGLASGAASVAKAVNKASIAKKELEEKKRHNLAMEKKHVGDGVYLKMFKKGRGLALALENQKKKRHSGKKNSSISKKKF